MWPLDPVHGASTFIVVCTPVDARLELVCEWLVEHGYSPLPAATAEAAVRLCRYTQPPLLILDLDLPDDSALDLLRGRDDANLTEVPVLLLVDRDVEFLPLMEEDPRLGVEDTLPKPFAPEKLGERIATILRRRHSRGSEVVRVGDLLVDPSRHRVLVGDRYVRLSKKEFALLRVLASDPTRVFSKDELLRGVWGLRAGSKSRTLDSHASRLRIKLDPGERRFVLNYWGIGYRLVESVEVSAESDLNDELVSEREDGRVRVSLEGLLSEVQIDIVSNLVIGQLIGLAGDLDVLNKMKDPRRAVREVAAFARLAFWLEYREMLVPDRNARRVMLRLAREIDGVNEAGRLKGGDPPTEHDATWAFVALLTRWPASAEVEDGLYKSPSRAGGSPEGAGGER